MPRYKRLGNMARHGEVILESNQEPILRTSDMGLMSVVHFQHLLSRSDNKKFSLIINYF